jgi:hypothetical protein
MMNIHEKIRQNEARDLVCGLPTGNGVPGDSFEFVASNYASSRRPEHE